MELSYPDLVDTAFSRLDTAFLTRTADGATFTVLLLKTTFPTLLFTGSPFPLTTPLSGLTNPERED